MDISNKILKEVRSVQPRKAIWRGLSCGMTIKTDRLFNVIRNIMDSERTYNT